MAADVLKLLKAEDTFTRAVEMESLFPDLQTKVFDGGSAGRGGGPGTFGVLKGDSHRNDAD